MAEIQLVQFDPAVDEALMSNPAYFDAMMKEDWNQVAELVHEVVGRTLSVTPKSIDELYWGGYCVVDAESREVVGSCAYKGEPSDEGAVEIAYFTYPGFEGKGYATLMAQKLISLASDSAAVKRVIAHTLAEKNASTRVLEKSSMQFLGEVTDPEDGQVWRWEIEVG